MAGLTPVTFDPEAKKVQAKGYVSSSIRQLQEQLQYQPGFAPDETGSNGSVSPPPSPGTSASTPPRPPQLDVRKKQLAIQLGSEFAKRQAASVKAHLSAWRARPLKTDAYNFTSQVGDVTHASQHVNSASAWLREVTPSTERTSTAPKSILQALEKKGYKDMVQDKWNEVCETEVEKLLQFIRDVTPVHDWDRTRVLGLAQREVLENSFSKIVQADCSSVAASPGSTCRCILALCLAGVTNQNVVKVTIEKQSVLYTNMLRITESLQSPPPPSPSCRTAPYPRKTGDPRSDMGLHKPGKVSVVRQKQLEVLLEHTKRRQREELLFYKRQERTQPLQDYHKRNGIKLGMTPIQVPCVASPTCFEQVEQMNCDQSVCSTVSMSVDDFELDSVGGYDEEARPPSMCSMSSVGTVSSQGLQGLRTTAELLGSLKLSQYTFDLKSSGYELPTDLIGITKQELLSIGLLPGHAQRLLNTIDTLSRGPPHPPPPPPPASWADSPVLRSLMES